MDKDKALKLALEFVENVHLGEWQGSTERQEEIVTAINKALAQPAQEPVGVVCVDTSHAHIIYGSQYLGRQPDKKTAMFFKDCEVGEQLYTLPPQRPWVGLTDEERSELVTLHHGWNEYGRAIEAKLKEKNT